MKKFLDSDWLRAVQFFRNTVPKNKIQCKKKKYSAKKEKYSANFVIFLIFFIFQFS